MAPVKQFTMAEVRQHNAKDDLWMVIHDRVYDVTSFQLEHPGGDEVLIEAAGKNATVDFDEVDHSRDAIEQMAQFYIGDIVDAERLEKKPAPGDSGSKPKQNGAKDTESSKPQANCPLWLGISAVAIGVGLVVLFKGYQQFARTR